MFASHMVHWVDVCEGAFGSGATGCVGRKQLSVDNMCGVLEYTLDAAEKLRDVLGFRVRGASISRRVKNRLESVQMRFLQFAIRQVHLLPPHPPSAIEFCQHTFTHTCITSLSQQAMKVNLTIPQRRRPHNTNV